MARAIQKITLTPGVTSPSTAERAQDQGGRQRGLRIWFAAQGAEPASVTGMLFDQFATMTQAAISGLGVAVLPDYLADTEIIEGRLAPVLKRSMPGSGSYWLVWPQSRANYPPLEAFRAWLATETLSGTS